MTAITPESFLKRLASLKTWSSGGVRAPHKPLLLLLTLGYLAQEHQEHSRMRLYRDIEPELRKLLEQFGPPRKAQKPEEPFKRLPNDCLWELEGIPASHMGPTDKLPLAVLRNIKGGFPSEIFDLLVSHPSLLRDTVEYLLDCHFPSSYHKELLEAVGLQDFLEPGDRQEIQNLEKKHRPRRDPNFRVKVLLAYKYRCAICDYDTRMYEKVIGLEAAHIRWHASGGPDEVSNGLALCMIHHKAFDRGGIGLADDFTLLVSPALHGQNEAWNYWFSRFEDQIIRLPQYSMHKPDLKHLQWHRREVFHRFPQ